MRRRGTIVVAALALAAALLLAAPGVAGASTVSPAQDEPGETTDETPVPQRDIIPEPGSGTPPNEAGDRGGALQFAVFGAIVVGVGVIVTFVVRESRRNRTGTPA